MTLICDCGSTKAEWVVLNDGNVVKRFITNGFNPNFTDGETIKSIISEAKDVVDNEEVSRVFFYGSGCGSEANKIKVSMLFAMVFKINDIEVFPDTLGACHALFGNNPGIACILGTGSNACVYDGEKITETVASLGFMIGDEGSGCHIGKRIVHDYFLGLMPEDLRKKFDEKYHLDRETFLKRVYQGEQPSRFLADFTKFAAENIENEYIKIVVGDCFEGFLNSSFRLKRNEVKCNGEILGLRELSDIKENGGFLDKLEMTPIGFVGSIAYVFQDILLQVLSNHHINCSKILKNPMDGLIEYYKSL
ncbi:MAG: hypothetical protein CW336_01445 [Bacteroidetes bacterium]|nr:hypothetical protein [Bacteroidota bacterium]